ncbi:MAG: polysaccharide biosynthesis protein [Eggerthellaceae bacterium]|nr:polysaccharide biosynthesis protein [Eggerthellaceae bacterium]
MVFDLLAFIAVGMFFFVAFPGSDAGVGYQVIAYQMLLCAVPMFASRFVFGVYTIIWRYGGAGSNVRLFLADLLGGSVYLLLEVLLPFRHLVFARCVSVVAATMLLCLAMRILYQWLCTKAGSRTRAGATLRRLLHFVGSDFNVDEDFAGEDASLLAANKVRVGIVGAGRSGMALADELNTNLRTHYRPVCFIDNSKTKAGRKLLGLPVLLSEGITRETLEAYGVQEIIVALPQKDSAEKKVIFDLYKSFGFPVKLYDFPLLDTAGKGKRMVREFDIEELLFRKPIVMDTANASAFYKNKVILITGGGGSIGSELCRQVAKMSPKQIVILDIAENGAYDIQQELKILYGNRVDLHVEICSVTDYEAVKKVFERYRPQVILHAAAHKHVPLMEHNVVEAIKNNVFGTLNVVKIAESLETERFILISTDKAVNPTNVMGATKRMCEMIVQAHGTSGKTVFSAVRFGNVLGSAGSVVPLFKRQIASGGPVTVTDERITRFFMTIPEASQLVLQSGVMAASNELFVLDMGEPVKILDLAKSMIQLMGYTPYVDIDIVETGLREGEKLYEELLIRTEELDTTSNNLIFIERDTPLPIAELDKKLKTLSSAVKEGDDAAARAILKAAVPTFKDPDEVNGHAQQHYPKPSRKAKPEEQ